MYPTAGFLRFITLLVLALTASISIAAKQQPPSEVLASSSLDNIEKLLSKGEVAGMAIAIVKNGRVQRTKSFGWRNAALKTQIGNDTIFEVASLSKPVVAYGVLQLVDRRLIGIDDPASKYIDSPELRDDTRWKTLTIMMLLDHTSGLPNELRPGERLSFSFTPGTRFSYSGIGFLFLQQIVEKVTRLSFEQYMETAIFKPLHMTSSSFVWRDDYDTRKANGHDNIGRPTAIRKPMVPKAPSSLHTSAADYARLLAAVLGRSGLSASRWKAMVTPQIPVQQDCVVCISKAAGQLSSAVEWGLGWGLEKTDHGSYVFHWGENNGDFQGFVEGDPSTQTGIVILTNSGNGFSIVPAIVQQIFPGKHEAFTWMGYDSYDSPFKTVLRRILAEGPEKVLSGADPQLSELQWNRIGYNLVARSKAREAIEVFEHNVSLHPKSSNVYDSLAEAYAAAGRTTEAIESYRRSLVLDPDNDNARQMIKKLQNSNAILQQMRGRWLGGMKLIDGRALTVAVNAVSTGKVETVLWPKNGREVDIRFHSRISSNSDGVDLIDEDGSDTLTGTVSDNEVHGYASFGAEHVKGEIALVQVNEGLSGNAAFDALGQRGFFGPEAFHELASAALKANDMQGALKWLRLGKQAKPGFPDALLFATDLAPIRRTREFKQLFEDPVASYAELSQATHSIKIERSVHIPMRDGIKLLADIYRPDEAERYPVILIRSPYERGTDIPPDDVAHYAARGYVVVIEAVRGTDGSEGEFQPWLNERKDGYDSIDWVSKQQWSIAKVGMLGLSYLGQAQWAAAVEAHPALKCIIPEVSGTDHMLDTPYDHGILRLELLGWSRNFVPIPKGSFSRPPLDDDLLIGLPLSAIDTAYTGHALPVWQRFLEFDRASAWSSANFLRDLTTVKIPVLNISGWWDSEANSTQTNYLAMRGLARDNQWLIYDPWAHVWNQSTKFRDMEYGPIAKIDFKSLSVRWFDQWLKGKAVDFEKVSKAQIFVTGSNRWVNLPDWPAPSAREKVFYLSAVADSCSAAVKKLGSEPTTDCSDSDLYTYDPADVKTGGSGVLPDDSTALHLRSAGRDMLVYETEPFESATIITSPGSLDLWFSTLAHDADFFVLIYDRDAYNVARAVAGPGKMRMKYMTGWDNPQVLSPGKLYHQPIEVRPFAHEFAKGHRLGIVLRSEWFPGYERNLNTGEPTKDATRIEIGEQRVFHDPTHASSLHLWQIQAK